MKTDDDKAHVRPDKTPLSKRLFRAVRAGLCIILTAVALLGALELVLTFAGVVPVLYEKDPYVGFSSYVPLFVDEVGQDGVVRKVTARNKLDFFGKQSFSEPKPDGTYRIFCMGGSTTAGRPYGDATSFCGWLRAMLPVAAPGRDYEVINAGGLSYASYRVAKLMEELIQYEPDLFIVYTGHNEFLEHRTYSEIRTLSPTHQRLGKLLGHTRLFSVVKRAVDKTGERAEGNKDDRAYLSAEVITMLDNSVGPEAYNRDDVLGGQILEHFENNLSRMVSIARLVDAEIVFITQASNIKDCSPFKSEHDPGLSDEDIVRLKKLLAGGVSAETPQEALVFFDKAAAIDGRFAQLHYLRGLALYDLGRFDEARAALIKARDEDICPLRAPTRLVEIVERAAAKHDTPLVDFARLAEEQSEHGITDNELFLDHVHPTIEGNRMLAMAILDELASQSILKIDAAWDDSAALSIKRQVEQGIDTTKHAHALRTMAQVFAWAGKFNEAEDMARRAIQLQPDNDESKQQYALLLVAISQKFMGTGDIDKALDYAERAVEVSDHKDAGVLHWLVSAYAAAGNLELAVSTAEQALDIAASSDNQSLQEYISMQYEEYKSALDKEFRKNDAYHVD